MNEVMLIKGDAPRDTLKDFKQDLVYRDCFWLPGFCVFRLEPDKQLFHIQGVATYQVVVEALRTVVFAAPTPWSTVAMVTPSFCGGSDIPPGRLT